MNHRYEPKPEVQYGWVERSIAHGRKYLLRLPDDTFLEVRALRRTFTYQVRHTMLGGGWIELEDVTHLSQAKMQARRMLVARCLALVSAVY